MIKHNLPGNNLQLTNYNNKKGYFLKCPSFFNQRKENLKRLRKRAFQVIMKSEANGTTAAASAEESESESEEDEEEEEEETE